MIPFTFLHIPSNDNAKPYRESRRPWEFSQEDIDAIANAKYPDGFEYLNLELTASDIVDVQPMDNPTGLCFPLKVREDD